MPKSLRKLISFLMLSSMVFLSPTSAQEIPKIESYGCLSRSQKEAIAISFEENRVCHDNLSLATSPSPIRDEWSDFLSAFVLGAIAAVVVQNNMRH